jgi:hypothetical protein
LITDGFDRRTVANMEVALERACNGLSAGEDHEARRHIAAKIVECASSGDITLTGLTRAAKAAAAELERHGEPPRNGQLPNREG